jgi:hypothetical protein
MPQPVDFQTEVAKTTAAQRVQDIADRAAMLAQQRLAAEERRNEAQAESRVGEAPETEHGDIREDGRKKGREDARRQRKRAQADASPDTPAGPGPDGEHQLDVSV